MGENLALVKWVWGRMTKKATEESVFRRPIENPAVAGWF
jgi:hypothetical protein